MRASSAPPRRARDVSRRGLIAGLAASAGLQPLLAGCASRPSVSEIEGSVPVELTARDDFIVPVRLDEAQSVPFKLDTGAGMSTLYEDFADLGVLSDPPERIRVWGLGGDAMRPLARIGRLRLGARTYSDLPVSVLRRSRPDVQAVGILGMDVLQDWVMEARATTRQRALYPLEARNRRQFHHWDRIALMEDPFGPHGFGLKFGSITVLGTQVVALFDLGSHLTIMNWEAARLVPKMRHYWESAYQSWRYFGAVGDFRVSVIGQLFNVSMGEARWQRVDAIITDLDSLSPLGSKGQPLIIAGANMFADRDFVFDPSGREIRIRDVLRPSTGIVL